MPAESVIERLRERLKFFPYPPEYMAVRVTDVKALLRVAEAAGRVADRDAIQRGRTIHAGNSDWERDKFLRDVAPLLDDLHEAYRALRAGGSDV